MHICINKCVYTYVYIYNVCVWHVSPFVSLCVCVCLCCVHLSICPSLSLSLSVSLSNPEPCSHKSAQAKAPFDPYIWDENNPPSEADWKFWREHYQQSDSESEAHIAVAGTVWPAVHTLASLVPCRRKLPHGTPKESWRTT